MRTLIGLHYSPWSERARWALDHHQVRYRREHYLPMLGEPWLRVRTRRWRGPLTVPVLIDHGHVFADSLDIARRAEDLRRGEPLFPDAARTEIEAWNARSEAALAAGRALLLARMVEDDAALDESLPRAIPAFAHRAMRPVARSAVRYLASKYRASAAPHGANRATMVEALDALRAALAGRDTLLSTGFSYADITMSVVLQMASPVADRFLRLPAATRRVWTDAELAASYADLVDWRDRLYAQHRGTRAR